ncbi:MAG: hypothetical protein IMZ46_10335 [Acidobacteria bacterium]|nr:hypothetical protein [Acidobacteriota bacterium]
MADRDARLAYPEPRDTKGTLTQPTLAADLGYLAEIGAVRQTDGGVRLTAQGIAFYEQIALGTSEFARSRARHSLATKARRRRDEAITCVLTV